MGIVMFRVEVTSPWDSDWHERDRELIDAAGRPAEFQGAGIQHGSNRRQLVWTSSNAEEAFDLKTRLDTVEGADVTVWEASTAEPPSRLNLPEGDPQPILPHPSAG